MVNEFPKTIREADPSKFSLREEALDLVLSDDIRHIYLDKETGERFHKISINKAQEQNLLALMLKGVINVSDVVKVGGNYYSHEQDFNNIASSKEDIKAEVQADTFILGEVFRDFDHKYVDNHPNSPAWKGSGSSYQHFNLLIDEENNKLNFFDFNEPWLDSLILEKNIKNLADLEKSFLEGIHINFGLTPNSTIMGILKRKIKVLIDFYSDDEFGRFVKIIKRSGIEMQDEEQQSLFDHIKTKLQVLDKVLLDLEHKNN